jgi:hypothetical protein
MLQGDLTLFRPQTNSLATALGMKIDPIILHVCRRHPSEDYPNLNKTFIVEGV